MFSVVDIHKLGGHTFWMEVSFDMTFVLMNLF